MVPTVNPSWLTLGSSVSTGTVVRAPGADCHRPRRRRSALGVMGPARRHGWWTPFDPIPLRCHTVTSRQRVTAEYGSPPGDRRHAGAGVGLYVLVRPPADP
jgi:hypothetical protein